MSELQKFLSPAETAAKLGVTIRALRLYERRGLVTPLRTQAGWRAFGPDQLERLHKVLVLKRLGLPLARIGELLDGHLASLAAVMAVQEAALLARRAETDRALLAVRAARARLDAGERLSVDDLTTLTKETTMSQTMNAEEWAEIFDPLTEKHMTPGEIERIKAMKANAAPFDQATVTAAWAALIAEAESLRQIGDPRSPAAFDLVTRWKALQDQFTGGDAEITASMAAIWRDALSDPSSAPKMPMSLEVWTFVGEASRCKGETARG